MTSAKVSGQHHVGSLRVPFQGGLPSWGEPPDNIATGVPSQGFRFEAAINCSRSRGQPSLIYDSFLENTSKGHHLLQPNRRIEDCLSAQSNDAHWHALPR